MSRAAGESKTPDSVITRFLGSGKTTLLNALLKHHGMAETAVLVDEFGEIGIDHLLFEALDDDVLLLAAGRGVCAAPSARTWSRAFARCSSAGPRDWCPSFGGS